MSEVNNNVNYKPFKILSFLFPIIGVIFYFIESEKNPPKAKACLDGLKLWVKIFIIIVILFALIMLIPLIFSSI